MWTSPQRTYGVALFSAPAGPQPMNGVCCATCKSPIMGNGTIVEGKSYHKDCFQCSSCHTALGKYFDGGDGAVICEGCAKAQAPKCFGCSQSVFQGSYITTDEGRTYHDQCFKCSFCKGKLAATAGHHKEGNQIACHACYEKKHPPVVCAKCGWTVQGRVLRGDGGKTFHPECFACSRCRKEIDGSYMHTDDGTGYLCTACQPRCGACGGSVSGRKFIHADGTAFHKECFRCCDCSHVIAGEFFNLPPPHASPHLKHRCKDCHARARQQNKVSNASPKSAAASPKATAYKSEATLSEAKSPSWAATKAQSLQSSAARQASAGKASSQSMAANQGGTTVYQSYGQASHQMTDDYVYVYKQCDSGGCCCAGIMQLFMDSFIKCGLGCGEFLAHRNRRAPWFVGTVTFQHREEFPN
mmetsp:Transcript_124963/g.400324  ORF Transcript_124963/g.400324 Transcript_124963/m.400324 type:complete len:413 (-) Transcript_124963:410-1648(-)